MTHFVIIDTIVMSLYVFDLIVIRVTQTYITGKSQKDGIYIVFNCISDMCTTSPPLSKGFILNTRLTTPSCVIDVIVLFHLEYGTEFYYFRVRCLPRKCF